MCNALTDLDTAHRCTTIDPWCSTKRPLCASPPHATRSHTKPSGNTSTSACSGSGFQLPDHLKELMAVFLTG